MGMSFFLANTVTSDGQGQRPGSPKDIVVEHLQPVGHLTAKYEILGL